MIAHDRNRIVLRVDVLERGTFLRDALKVAAAPVPSNGIVSRELRATRFRLAKVALRRGHFAFHRSPAESKRRTHRETSRSLFNFCPLCCRWVEMQVTGFGVGVTITCANCRRNAK